MGMALWQARYRAQPEPSSLALTHPLPGTALLPAFLSSETVGSWLLGMQVSGQPCPSVPLILGGFLQRLPEPSIFLLLGSFDAPGPPRKRAFSGGRKSAPFGPAEASGFFSIRRRTKKAGVQGRQPLTGTFRAFPVDAALPTPTSSPALAPTPIPCRLTGGRVQLPACSVVGLPGSLGAGGEP